MARKKKRRRIRSESALKLITDAQFRHRVVKSKRVYSRKRKTDD